MIKLIKYALFSIIITSLLFFLVLAGIYIYNASLISDSIADFKQENYHIVSDRCKFLYKETEKNHPYPKDLTDMVIFLEKPNIVLTLADKVIKSDMRRNTKKWIVATLEIKRLYTFEDQVQYYMNGIYLGTKRGCPLLGFKTAASHYFNKKVKNLSIQQKIMLAAIIKGSNYYNPYKKPEKMLLRINFVLEKFCGNHVIQESSCQAIKIEDLKLINNPLNM